MLGADTSVGWTGPLVWLGMFAAGAFVVVITLWALPDTPHIAALRTHPGEYKERVLGFLDQALLGLGGTP